MENEEGMCEIVHNYFADLFVGDVTESDMSSTENQEGLLRSKMSFRRKN